MEEFLKGITSPDISVTKSAIAAEISKITIAWLRIGSQDFCCGNAKTFSRWENEFPTTTLVSVMDPDQRHHKEKKKETNIH